jgi:hypothetical protein
VVTVSRMVGNATFIRLKVPISINQKLKKKEMHSFLNDPVLAKPYKLKFFIWDLLIFNFIQLFQFH